MKASFKISLVISSLISLAACGGGGADDSASQNPPSAQVAQPTTPVTTPSTPAVVPDNTLSTYTVSTVLSLGGQISASQLIVNSGESAVFVISPDTNYEISHASGCNGSLLENTYTTGSVTADCELNVDFAYQNQVPTISIQGPSTANENSTLVLTALSNDVEDDTLNIAWTQLSGVALSTSGADTNLLSIEVPELTQNEKVSFQASATDSAGATATQMISVDLFNSEDPIEIELDGQIALIGVTALSSNSISLDWQFEDNNSAITDETEFSVYISQLSPFLPNEQNRVLSLQALSSAVVDGLLANTEYHVIVGAKYKDLETRYSNQLTVTTMSSAPVSNNVGVLHTLNNLEVGENSLRYTRVDGDKVPEVGEIVVSASQNGVLRRVTAVVVSGDTIEIQTAPAGLNELYKNVDINATIKLIDTVDDIVPAGESVSTNNNITGLHVTNNNSTNTEAVQEILDKHLLLTGPNRIRFTPNIQDSFEITAQIINDPQDQFEISDLKLVNLSHELIAANVDNFSANTVSISSDNTPSNSKTLAFLWQPTLSNVDAVSSQPYIATFTAQVIEKNCASACLRSTANLQVKIDVSNAMAANHKSVSFSHSNANNTLSITAEGAYHFEPEVNVFMQIQDATLSNAKTSLLGFLDMQLELGVQADSAGILSGTKEVARKAFTKTLIVGNAPVVIHGDFVLNAQYSINAQSQLDIDQLFDIGYFFEAGFEYINNSWQPVMSGEPRLTYRLLSGAKSQLQSELILIPDIQIKLYETELSHIQVAPKIQSELVLEGIFDGLSQQSSNIQMPQAYRFEQLNASIEAELKVKADVSALDRSITPWPQQSTDNFNRFSMFDNTLMYGLPVISIQDEARFDLPNSCTVSALASVTPRVTSIFADTNAQQWQSEGAQWQIISGSSLNTLSVDTQPTELRAQVYHDQPSELVLRLSGYTGLGAWAIQHQDIRFDFSDNNNDSVPDYWSNKYNISDLLSDYDDDGILDANEFQYCTFPNKQDSDNDLMPDGWEVTKALNPISDDANGDDDNDSRSNLQEYLDASNPQVADQNQAPVVLIGDNQSVNEGSIVSLVGNASDGGSIATLNWEQVSGPLVALDTTTNANRSATTTFIAPKVSQQSVLSFVFSATDNSNARSSAQVDITVLPVNANPVAVAGTDLQALSGETIFIDGQDSFDSDGAIISYTWTSPDTSLIRFSDALSSNTFFTAPEVVSVTTFTLELEVVDNEGATASASINVEVSPDPALPELSSISLSELSDTLIIFRIVDQDGLNSSLALLLEPSLENQQMGNAQAHILHEELNIDNNEVSTRVRELSLSWQVDGNNLIINGDNINQAALSFDDGIVDVLDVVSGLSPLFNTSENASVSALYKRKSLISNDLQGYSLTLLKNGSNQIVDFVNSSRAFVYDEGSNNINAIDWALNNAQLEMEIDADTVINQPYSSFNTFDKFGDALIVNLSLVPIIEQPLSELNFNDNNLAACVESIAQSNDWLSVTEFTYLDCSSQNIVNTQGLEGLSALQSIDLSGNQIVNINLSQLSDLDTLNLSNNQLQSIDFSNNPLLQTVQLTNNNLSNASISYLATISWIDSLSFDEVTAFPTGNDFLMQVTVEAGHEFTIFTNNAYEYDFTVEWGDGNVTTNHSEDAVHTYAQAGAFEVKIYGTYPALAFCEDNSGCSDFKLDVTQWGSNQWQSMQATFSGLTKINIVADDEPDLREVENLSFMFYKASNFNSDISHWDISNVTDMNFMFGLASSFNSDLSQWDTSNVTNMGGLFYFASSFNGNISQWNTSSVTRMHSLFAFATSFNTDISQWDTSSVTQMTTMFLGASNFNGNLSLWDVSQVTNMNKMFYDANRMAGNLSNWNVSDQVSHRDFSHQGSLLIEPMWQN